MSLGFSALEGLGCRGLSRSDCFGSGTIRDSGNRNTSQAGSEGEGGGGVVADNLRVVAEDVDVDDGF